MTRLLFLTLLPLLGSGCATVFSGTAEDVYFTSEPSGAMVYLDYHPLGRTPLITKVPRRLRERYIRYELEGYEPVEQLMDNRLNGITFINLLWWPGFIVDAVSGAIVRIEYDRYYMELYPLPETIANPRRD